MKPIIFSYAFGPGLFCGVGVLSGQPISIKSWVKVSGSGRASHGWNKDRLGSCRASHGWGQGRSDFWSGCVRVLFCRCLATIKRDRFSVVSLCHTRYDSYINLTTQGVIMGRLSLDGMLDEVGFAQALRWHLTHNHYPSVPLTMFNVCVSAITAVSLGNDSEDIPMPEGVKFRGSDSGKAYELVSSLHLDGFIEFHDSE